MINTFSERLWTCPSASQRSITHKSLQVGIVRILDSRDTNAIRSPEVSKINATAHHFLNSAFQFFKRVVGHTTIAREMLGKSALPSSRNLHRALVLIRRLGCLLVMTGYWYSLHRV